MKLKETPEDFIVEEIPVISLTPQGEYSIFKLTKKEWNTEDAIQEICKRLHISRNLIGYSGTKDKNAITEQYVSIKASKEKVLSLKIQDITIEYIGQALKQINLGDHLGNQFSITARECENTPKPKSMIINYFGEQRFSKNNVEIGKALLKKDFKTAASLITVETGRNAEAVKEHLLISPTDYLGAIKKIPRKVVTIFLHSFQSKLWNQVAKQLAADKNPIPHLPLVGFRTKFETHEIEEIYSNLLEKEGISLSDFVIKQWPEISSEGSERMLYVPMQELKITMLGNKAYRLEFFLPKGSYATVAVQQICS